MLLTCAGLALAVACGKTDVFRTERFACNTTGDCADGYTCSNGECTAGASGGGGETGGGSGGGAMGGGSGGGASTGDAGSTCTSTTQCFNGLTCVDGVCCRTACAAPCDHCNAPGMEGTCVARAAGSSIAQCNGYACNGDGVTCPTTCRADAGFTACSPGYACAAPSCVPCWGEVTDNFTTPTNWMLTGATVLSGTLNVDITSSNGNARFVAGTHVRELPLAGCGVSFELPQAPAVSGPYTGELGFFDATDGVPSFVFTFDSRGLVASWKPSIGPFAEQVLVPAGTAPPRWLRLEESAGEVRWRGSDGGTFTTLHTLTHGESLETFNLEFNARFPQTSGNHNVVYRVDNLNLGP